MAAVSVHTEAHSGHSGVDIYASLLLSHTHLSCPALFKPAGKPLRLLWNRRKTHYKRFDQYATTPADCHSSRHSFTQWLGNFFSTRYTVVNLFVKMAKIIETEKPSSWKWKVTVFLPDRMPAEQDNKPLLENTWVLLLVTWGRPGVPELTTGSRFNLWS